MSEEDNTTLKLSLNATQRILYIEATGPFDAEFGKEYERQIVPLRQALVPIGWASLAKIKAPLGDLTISAESKSFLQNSIKQARLMGLKVTSIVLDKNVSDAEIASWRSLYEEVAIPFGIFSSESEAETFLTLTLNKLKIV